MFSLPLALNKDRPWQILASGFTSLIPGLYSTKSISCSFHVSAKCVVTGSRPAHSSPGGEIKQKSVGMRFVVFQETSPKHSNPLKTFVSPARRKYVL